MNKKLILGLAAVMLLTGCQKAQEIDPEAPETPVVIETTEETVVTEQEEVVGEEIAEVLEDNVVAELHEWTEADQEQLDAFVIEADSMTIAGAKALLDEKIQDASSMMADRYVNYYENRLIMSLSHMSDIFFRGSVQQDLVEAFNYGYFSRDQLKGIDAKETIEIIDPIYDIGYKVETSEGMYYPIVDYSVLYQYEDKVTSGVKEYLRLMKRQSDIMAYSDAAVVVPWSELGERLLMTEKLLDMEMPAEMKERVNLQFNWGLRSFVFGTSNTPVFDFVDQKINDPEILAAFKEVTEKSGTRVKSVMEPYMVVLEEEDYTGTDKVYETVNQLIQEHIEN